MIFTWKYKRERKKGGTREEERRGRRADAAARRVNVRMINEERWIMRPACRRANAYRSRLLITRFAWNDKNKTSIDWERREKEEKLM